MKRVAMLVVLAACLFGAATAQATFWEMRSQITSLVDDGQMWQVQGFDEDTMVGVGYFTSLSSIFDNKMIFRSLDGGQTVEAIYTMNIGLGPGFICRSLVSADAIHFTDGGNGLAFGAWAGSLTDCGLLSVEQPYIINTSDGGASWDNIALPQVVNETALFAVDFLDDSFGVTAGAENSIWATGNGGGTWAKLADAPSAFDETTIYSVSVATENDIYLAAEEQWGDDDTWWDGGPDDDNPDDSWGEPTERGSGDSQGLYGQLFGTSNGGASWTLLKSDETVGYHKVQFLDADHGWLLALNEDSGLLDLAYTTDGGTTWTSGVLPEVPGVGTPGDLYFIADFQMLNLQVGWAVGYSAGDNSVILKTDDGGATWDADDYSGEGGLRGIHMVNGRLGFAVGDKMTVVRYINTENNPPVADAGEDQTVGVGQVVDLDGTGSYDPDGDPITTYTWAQVSGPDATMSGADTDTASFPASDGGEYIFQLVVSDGMQTSAADQVLVTVTGGDDDGDDDSSGDDDNDDDNDDDDGGLGDDDAATGDDDDDDDDDDSGCCG